jgi:ABC-2 type transport system ATP-binding protein
MNTIEIRGLVKRFGSFTALHGLDLTVPQGKVFAFIGPNGAGKTTTLRIMTGLSRANAGTVTIAGVKVGSTTHPPIGFLPDQPGFYGWMNSRQFLAYIAQLHHLDNPPIDAILERVGLGDVGRKKIGGFSRGMKQRLGLAQALLHQPAVLLLDEPASALDPAGRREVLDIINELRGEMTIFFSTHILNDAEHICDMVGILNEGKLLLQADRDQLLAQHARPIFEIETVPDDVPNLRALTERLQTLPWVKHAELNRTLLRLHVDDFASAQHLLFPMLTDVTVLRFETVSASLEDVFLSLTHADNGKNKVNHVQHAAS